MDAEIALVERYRELLLEARAAKAALFQDADSAVVEARQRADSAASAGRERGGRTPAKNCTICGKAFRPKLRGGRALYCDKVCRQRAWQQRQAYSEAEADREATREILEQNTREGYPNLNWGSSNGQA